MAARKTELKPEGIFPSSAPVLKISPAVTQLKADLVSAFQRKDAKSLKDVEFRITGLRKMTAEVIAMHDQAYDNAKNWTDSAFLTGFDRIRSDKPRGRKAAPKPDYSEV